MVWWDRPPRAASDSEHFDRGTGCCDGKARQHVSMVRKSPHCARAHAEVAERDEHGHGSERARRENCRDQKRRPPADLQSRNHDERDQWFAGTENKNNEQSPRPEKASCIPRVVDVRTMPAGPTPCGVGATEADQSPRCEFFANRFQTDKPVDGTAQQDAQGGHRDRGKNVRCAADDRQAERPEKAPALRPADRYERHRVVNADDGVQQANASCRYCEGMQTV